MSLMNVSYTCEIINKKKKFPWIFTKAKQEIFRTMSEIFEVIVGIYEGYVCGYKLTLDRSSKLPTVQISRTFAGALHTQSVRSVATGGHLLASGGADDRVRVYDLSKRQEIRELMHHTGTVNSVVFVDNAKYLITGGSDGKIAFINTKKWQLDKIWEKAHKGAVTCISVHPEESLALTIGTDLILKTWNLVNGRNVYSTSLKNKSNYGGVVEHIRWCPNGDYFALTGARCVEVFSLDTGNVIKSHKLEHRITDLCWIGDADILVGQDNGEMFFFNIETDESSVIPAHDTRLKAMYFVDGILATISSGGDLSIWHISDDYTEIIQLREYSLECRPTCLCVVQTSKMGMTIPSPEDEGEDNYKPVIDDEFNEDKQFSKTVEPEEDRVIVEYENDLENLTKTNNKSKKRGKRNHAEINVTAVESVMNDETKEEFKGQKKRKVIEEQLKTKSYSTPKKLNNKKKQKSRASMQFQVTDDVQDEENDTVTNNDPTSNKNVKKTKSALSKSFTTNKKFPNTKKKRQSL